MNVLQQCYNGASFYCHWCWLMSFTALNLQSDLLAVLADLGYQVPTPIQQEAIPEVLAGHDVLAGAQTGTGKTAAFALPLIHRYLAGEHTGHSHPRILVLTPTRELAQQVHLSFEKYSQGLAFNSVVAYGGASINPQIEALIKGCQVLVATPGRLLDLVSNGHLDLASLETLVLDEADRMLDMGFIVDIRRIIKHLPEQHQTLFFSATFNDDVFALSKTLLNEPKLIEVAERNAAAAEVEQKFYEVDGPRKAAMLAYLIGSQNWQQVLIFTRTKQGADLLAKELGKDGIKAVAVHGDKAQGARDRGLEEFKTGKVRALVATDVAARGLDIQALQYVVNYELPYNAEDYIHRIGRTGRAGNAGTAVSLVANKEKYLFDDVKKLTGNSFMLQWFEGFEPDILAQEQADSGKRKPSKKALRAKALGQNNRRR